MKIGKTKNSATEGYSVKENNNSTLVRWRGHEVEEGSGSSENYNELITKVCSGRIYGSNNQTIEYEVYAHPLLVSDYFVTNLTSCTYKLCVYLKDVELPLIENQLNNSVTNETLATNNVTLFPPKHPGYNLKTFMINVYSQDQLPAALVAGCNTTDDMLVCPSLLQLAQTNFTTCATNNSSAGVVITFVALGVPLLYCLFVCSILFRNCFSCPRRNYEKIGDNDSKV